MGVETDKLIQALKESFGELAGEDLIAVDENLGFMDLGFDSLFLTQVSARLYKSFKVKVAFRQLLEDCDSFRSLAEYIYTELPDNIRSEYSDTSDEAVSEESTSPGPSELETPSSERPILPATLDGGDELQAIVNEQLRVMEKQIELLKNRTGRKATLADKAVVSVDETTRKSKGSEDEAVAKPISSGQHGPYRQRQNEMGKGLTEQQKCYLDKFVERYVSKSPKSKTYTQRYRKAFADPRAVAGFNQRWKEMVYPIVAEKSKGAKLWDLDGNEWTDVTMGFGVALLGHSPDYINDAIRAQLEKGVEIGPQSPIAGEVAELICEFTGMDRVTFCNTGSEAVMAALRICRTVTGRSRAVLFAGGYHGTFDEVLVKGVTFKGKPKTLPLAPGVLDGHISEMTVLEYGTPDSLEWIRENADELAAVLVETVQSRHPDLQPKEFLQEIREITKKAETPLIFDEVITGFRCHPGGAQAYFGIEADLATYGKVVGGGMPIGFIAGKAEYMDALDGGFWEYGNDSFPAVGITFFAGTFVRHPLAMAAAKAMLIYLKEQGEALQSSLAEKAKGLVDELNSYFAEHQVPIKLERFTSVWYPKFGDDVTYASLLYYHLREKGLHVWEGRPCFISSAHKDENVAFIVEAFKESVAEMQFGGFLQGSSDQRYREKAAAWIGTPPLDGQDLNQLESVNRFPVAEGQREMWLGAQMSKEAAGPQHTCNAMVLEGPLNVEALFESIGKVVERHEGLRAVFSEDGSEVIVKESIETKTPFIDLSDLDPNQVAGRVAEIMDTEARQIFDLSEGPLFAFKLIKEGPELYRLIFTAQMIVCDGWSHYVVFEEMSTLYSGIAKGESLELPPAAPMREYALWEEEHSDSEEADECRTYWKNVFATTPPPLDLPTRGSRPRTRTVDADRCEIELDGQFYDRIKKYALREKSSTFAVLLAAFQTLLSRLSSQDDVVVGVPFSMQGALGMDSLVGQCANTLPFRAKIGEKMPFRDLLKQTWANLLDGQEHSNFTFGKLLEELDLPVDPSRIPLVSALFNLDPAMSKVRFDGLTHRFESGPRIYFQYDLGFNLVENEKCLRIECDFNTNLFDDGVIESWIHVYKKILESVVVSDCKESVQRLPIGQSPSLVNRDPKIEAIAQEKSLVDLFSEQVCRSPDSMAAISDADSLSYEGLEARSNQIAYALLDEGVVKGSIVGLCMERSIDVVASILGVLKSGAAYMPIDDRFPSERKRYLIENSEANFILVDSPESDIPECPKAQLICLNEIAQTHAKARPENPEIAIDPSDLAYVIYTSGSTGQPKGVEVPHRAATNFLLSMVNLFSVDETDRTLALTSLSFDISLLELFLPLTSGGSVYIASREDVLDPKSLTEIVEKNGITLMQTTPSSWRLYLDAGWKGRADLKILSGGEDLSSGLAKRLLQQCGQLWNMYGPTETTVWSSAHRVQRPDEIVIGEPIANTSLFVLDQNRQPLPVGVPGELCVGGLGLANGYRKQPELTRDKFVDWPDEDVERFYNTGDRAVIEPDGSIKYIGRSDHQFKIRGCLVEPGEIEAVLAESDSVAQSLVVHRKLDSNDRLLAYIKLNEATSSEVDDNAHKAELRELIQTRLPDYMRIHSFIVIDSFPVTSEGKLDRARLPDPSNDDGLGLVGHERAQPETETERKLALIWKDVLRIDSVGIDDSFFDLGGQSLIAVKLFKCIGEELDTKLPLASLFEFPTIRQLAKAIDGDEENAAWPSLVKIKGGSNGKPPLFLVHGAGGNVLLYQALVKRLPGELALYGLQSQGLDGSTKPLATIEDMAERYLSEIREIQPLGPYHLGGYCLGGTIAYEMAQRLVSDGEEVAFVAMLDTYNFSKALKVSPTSFIIQKLNFHLANLTKIHPKNLPGYFKEKLRLGKDGEFANLFSSRPGATAEGVTRAQDGAEANVQAINDDAVEAYIPKPFPGRVVQYKPQANYKFYPDPKMGWGGLIDDLEIIELPMNPHAMLVEPFVEKLTTELVNLMGPSNTVPTPSGTEAYELARH